MILRKYTSTFLSILTGLSEREKTIIALCNLFRHLPCVQKFDAFYKENLSDDYAFCLTRLKDYLSGIAVDLEDIKKMAIRAPDSDDYPETEGSIALNAFGALYYLCKFIESKNDKDFLQSIDKSFESTDALQYNERDLEEDCYFLEEAKKLKNILEKVIQNPTTTTSEINSIVTYAQTKNIGT